MSSLDDILTASKNIVVALNNNSQTNLNIQGSQAALAISSNTSVKIGNGRIAIVSVTVAGSAPGALYDAASVSLAGTANKMFVIPNTVGTTVVNLPFLNGLVVEPGSGQTVTVSYS